jgi:hypothetical protein
MAVNKNFVVRNGIEVATDLIVSSVGLDAVGLGTTTPTSRVDVAGGLVADNILSRAYGITTSLGEFNVGTGGTIISAIPDQTKIGFHTSSPSFSFQIDQPTADPTSLYVKTGDIVINDGNLKVSGVSSIGYLDVGAIEATGIRVTGVTTIASIDAQGAHVGVATVINLDNTGATIGIATITNLINTGADIGIATITNLVSTGATIGVATITNLVNTDATIGVATIGLIYGDGSNITGIATELTATIGIKSEGTNIGSGITQIDFKSTNGSAIAVDVPPATAAGVATVTFTPGVSIGLVIALGS